MYRFDRVCRTMVGIAVYTIMMCTMALYIYSNIRVDFKHAPAAPGVYWRPGVAPPLLTPCHKAYKKNKEIR